MGKKEEVLNRLDEEKRRWENIVESLSEEELTAHDLPNQWSIKDVFAHLMAWQQTTNARLQAALQNRQPVIPEFAQHEMEIEGPPDKANAWIYKTYQDQPWAAVYSAWRDGFQRVLDMGKAIPEMDLLDTKKYPWLEGYSLYDVLQSSYEHHHIEHYEPLYKRFQ